MERWNRADIQGAPYNPRVLDPIARRRLEQYIKKQGLLAPITVNRRTKNVVGGHQRLTCIDALMGRGDYELDVAVVELTDKEEREANIFLNNPGAQGSWDVEALGKLIVDSKLDTELMGFAKIDLEDMFEGMPEMASIFSVDAAPEAVKDAAKAVADIAEMKAARKAHKDAASADENLEIAAVVVFDSVEERDKFCKFMGRADKYVDGRALAHKLGLELKSGNSEPVGAT